VLCPDRDARLQQQGHQRVVRQILARVHQARAHITGLREIYPTLSTLVGINASRRRA
jgi:hypothetical protein